MAIGQDGFTWKSEQVTNYKIFLNCITDNGRMITIPDAINKITLLSEEGRDRELCRIDLVGGSTVTVKHSREEISKMLQKPDECGDGRD